MESRARPRLTLLSAEQIESVHEASLVLLARSGLRVDSERSRRVLAEGGARVEDDTVYPSRELVEWAVDSAPATLSVHGCLGDERFRIGGASETRFGVGVTNLWYQDPVTDELSPFARSHMASGVRLARSAPGVRRDLNARVS